MALGGHRDSLAMQRRIDTGEKSHREAMAARGERAFYLVHLARVKEPVGTTKGKIKNQLFNATERKHHGEDKYLSLDAVLTST